MRGILKQVVGPGRQPAQHLTSGSLYAVTRLTHTTNKTTLLRPRKQPLMAVMPRWRKAAETFAPCRRVGWPTGASRYSPLPLIAWHPGTPGYPLRLPQRQQGPHGRSRSLAPIGAVLQRHGFPDSQSPDQTIRLPGNPDLHGKSRTPERRSLAAEGLQRRHGDPRRSRPPRAPSCHDWTPVVLQSDEWPKQYPYITP